MSEALVANKTVISLTPKDASAYYNLGITFKELKKLKEAQSSYLKAIALKPDFAEAHYNLSVLFVEIGNGRS